MGDNSPMRFGAFEALVKKWNYRIEKTTKEWEVRDNNEKLIRAKRGINQPRSSNEQEGN